MVQIMNYENKLISNDMQCIEAYTSCIKGDASSLMDIIDIC